LKVQPEIAAGGGRRVPGRHRRGGGARRGRGVARAARGRVERRAAGRTAAAGVYDVRWDINADGAVTWADYNHYPDIWMGRGVLSHVGNRFGYAGYQHAPELAGAKWHLRHRMMDSILGRFMNRDPHPTPYVDGMNLYQYVRGMALLGVDPFGLVAMKDGLIQMEDASASTFSSAADVNSCKANGGACQPTPWWKIFKLCLERELNEQCVDICGADAIDWLLQLPVGCVADCTRRYRWEIALGQMGGYYGCLSLCGAGTIVPFGPCAACMSGVILGCLVGAVFD
jgi:RHS repeat-associated protein